MFFFIKKKVNLLLLLSLVITLKTIAKKPIEF